MADIMSDESKTNRRSRFSTEGRDHAWECGKTYLSYSALYTHIKTKHGSDALNSVKGATGTSNRGRGRPPKSESEQREPAPKKKPRIDSQALLNELGFEGGPTDPLAEFPTNQDTNILLKYITQWKQEIEESRGTTANDILAIYLLEIAQQITSEGYFHVVQFTENFRRCLNLKGWDHLQDQDSSGKIFCEEFDTQIAPEVCNDFITQFLPDQSPKFDRNMAIKLTMHLIDWLYSNKYTTLRLQMA